MQTQNRQLFQDELKRLSLPKDLEIIISELVERRLKDEEVATVSDYINRRLTIEQVDELVKFIKNTVERNGCNGCSDSDVNNNCYPLNCSFEMSPVIRFFNRLGRFQKNLFGRLSCGNIKVLAEGDSWFEHFFLCDIINQLQKYNKLKIKTLGSGGDWLTNYLHKNEFIQEVKTYKPDVFLLSGGGNDLVGALKQKDFFDNQKIEEFQASPKHFAFTMQQYADSGAQFLTDKFYIFKNIIYIHYLIIIRMLTEQKVKLIITQGYDYAIPRDDDNTCFQKLFTGGMHGKWLKKPLEDSGYTDSGVQRAIIGAIIDQINELLINISEYNDNVIHIDNRDVAVCQDDWADELHLKSRVYKKVAKKYFDIIEKLKTYRTTTP